MAYTVEFKPAASRQMRKLPDGVRKLLAPIIDSLSENPHPLGAYKLQGQNAWRVRFGDYRVVYEIHDNILTVLVLKIGHRREVYR